MSDPTPDPFADLSDAQRRILERTIKRTKNQARRKGLRRGYTNGVLATLSELLSPGDLVFDCGANMGNVTAPLAQSGADVIAFEPDPMCVARLQSRFADQPNVTIRQAAVADYDGEAQFFRRHDFAEREAASQAGTLVQGNANITYDDGGFSVKVVNFVTILEQAIAERGQIAVMKIDIEGSEVGIMQACLEKGLFDHIKISLIETHEVQYPDLADKLLPIKAAIAARYAPSRVNLDWV